MAQSVERTQSQKTKSINLNVANTRGELETLCRWIDHNPQEINYEYSSDGPDHAPIWTCQCNMKYTQIQLTTQSTCPTRKDAMRSASKLMIEELLKQPLNLPFPLRVVKEDGSSYMHHFTINKAKPIGDYHDHTTPIKSHPHKPPPQASSTDTEHLKDTSIKNYDEKVCGIERKEDDMPKMTVQRIMVTTQLQSNNGNTSEAGFDVNYGDKEDMHDRSTPSSEADSDQSIRNSWEVGSKVEIYSKSSTQWFKGKITDIVVSRSTGLELLQVLYNGPKGAVYSKSISRNSNIIRPPKQSVNIRTISSSTVPAIDSCNHLIEALNKYKRNDIYIPNLLEILNEFQCILQSADQTQLLDSIFNQLKHCDVATCVSFQRNYRNRSEYTDQTRMYELYEMKDDQAIASCQLMDTMHCFCHHSYDTGNRLSINEQNILHQSDANEPKLATLKDILSKKNTNIMNQMRQRMRQRMNANEPNQFIFGCEFDYDYDEKQTSNDLENKIRFSPRYPNQKDELTQNDICRITIPQYMNEMYKLQVLYRTRFRKEHYAKIFKQHLLSLMIYCNFDKLQFEFSKTYRDHSGMRHNRYFHFGRSLKHAVLQFGTPIRDSVLPQKCFYHGINQRLVPTQIVGDLGKGVAIYCPLSTSTSYTVAVNTFTNQNEGVVIEFGGDRSMAKYFDVKWLSDHAYENECLFLQNKHELRINNITDCKLCCEYKAILNTLKSMDSMLAEDYYHDDIAIKEKRTSMPLVTKMIENQLSTNNTNFYKSDYAKQLVNVYFDCQRILNINYSVLKQNYTELFELFCSLKEDEEWINITRLCDLFPNIVHVSVKNISLCTKVMHYIFECYQGDMTWELNKMKIRIAKNSALNATDAASLYAKRFSKLNMTIRAVGGIEYTDTLLIGKTETKLN
eukprot:1010178_1